jgi:hypothetical protein
MVTYNVDFNNVTPVTYNVNLNNGSSATYDVDFTNVAPVITVDFITGIQGLTGIQGEPGSTWYNGDTSPAGGLGVDGDYYVNNITYDLSNKVGGAWGVISNIKGAPGVTGSSGNAATKIEFDAVLTDGNFMYIGDLPSPHTHLSNDITDFAVSVSTNTAVATNTAKVGITSNQASAITANTAKTGITSGQASAITANTAKTGITAGQASDITANNAKISYNNTASTKLDGIEAGAEVNVVDSVAGKTGVVTLVKGDVGLSNVDNTSDSAKPISTAGQTALNLKANLASPTFTGTVGGVTAIMVGLGNVTDESKAVMFTSPTFTGTVVGVTKEHVVLGNADNTSDINKPVSTAQQTSLDLKQNLSEKNAISGYAGLDGSGKIDPSQLPALAITDTFVVATQAAQVALTAEVGDVALRTDINKSFILQVSPASTFANWQELLTPTTALGGGTISLIEQAAANADVAGSGQIWVKAVTPNQLWFTDDAGTDIQLTGLPTARNLQDFTATAGQTTFTVTNGYIVGLIDVFVNGSKLTSSEFTATNGTTFVLTVASTVSDQVQSINYTASVSGISGAGTVNELAYFTASGTIASLPVATYPSLTELSYTKGVTSAIQTQINTKQAAISLTTTGTSGAATFSANTLNIPNYGSALSAYLPLTGGTLTGALGGTSATFSSSVTAQSLITSYSLDGDPALATFTNANAGTSAEAVIYIKNGASTNDATFIETTGTNFTTTGGFVQDGGVIGTGTALSGGMSLMVRANADMRFYTNGHTNVRMRITSGGNVLIGTTDNAGYKLDVNGTGRFSGATVIGTAATGKIELNQGTGNPNIEIFGGAGSNSVGGSAYYRLRDQTNSQSSLLQINASGGLDFWFQYGGTFYNRATISNTGAATFSSTGCFGGGTNGGATFAINNGGAEAKQTFAGFSSNLNLTQCYNNSGAVYVVDEYRAASYSFKIGTTPALTIASTGAATFGAANTETIGNLNLNGGIGDSSTYDVIQTLSRTSSTGNVLAAQIALTAPSTYQQNLVFRIKSTASSGHSAGYFKDALTITSGGVLQAKYGISFPNQSAGSGTVSSSTLDAYEEGTWTPRLNQGGADVTPSQAIGTYIRVGNLLHIGFYFYSNTPNSLSGSWVVKGLPYNLKYNQTNAYPFINFGYNSINGDVYTTGRGQVNTTSALDVYASWYNTSFTTASLEVSGSGTLLIA